MSTNWKEPHHWTGPTALRDFITAIRNSGPNGQTFEGYANPGGKTCRLFYYTEGGHGPGGPASVVHVAEVEVAE